MDKGDWEFVVSIVVALVGLLGLDWKKVGGMLPIPNMNGRRDWLFLIAIVGSLALSSFGLYQQHHRDPLKWTLKQSDEEEVYGKTFRNEEVLLDGKRFDHCTFENVTFLYHATAPVDFVDVTFTQNGTLMIKTDNDAAKGFVSIANFLQHLPGVNESILGTLDTSGNIHAEFHDTRVPPPSQPAATPAKQQ